MKELSNEFLKVVDHMPTDGINIVLGTDVDGKTVYTDLSKVGHIMVTSDNEHEMTDTMLTIAGSLMCRNDKYNCSIFVIDLHDNSSHLYEERNHVTHITNLDYAVGFLNMCCTIMQKRTQMVIDSRVNDIYKLNDPFIFPIVIIIEHADDLMNRDSNTYRYITKLLEGMNACGIHLILGYNTSNVCPPAEIIEKKIPARVAFSKAGFSEIKSYHRALGKNNNAKIMKFYRKATRDSITISPLNISDIELKYAIMKICYELPEELRFYNSALRRDAKEFYRCIIEVKNKRFRESLAPQKPRRIGLLKRMWILWNTPPVMFKSTEYPIRLK